MNEFTQCPICMVNYDASIRIPMMLQCILLILLLLLLHFSQNIFRSAFFLQTVY